jgi:hypothetical protein
LIDYEDLNKQKKPAAALLGDTTVACVGSDYLIRIYVIATGKGGLICDIDRGNRAQ